MAKKKITDEQFNKYALCLFHGMTQRQAYLEVFPNERRLKDKTLDNKASTLAKNEEIIGRLERLREKEKIHHEKQVEREFLTRDMKKAILLEIATDPEATKTERIKAIDIDNKMDGEYVTKTEISGSLDMQKSKLDDLIRQMTDE